MLYFESLDIIKFYELHTHYDPIATNIGIVGDRKRFNLYLKEFEETYNKPRYSEIL